jgi:hypothetical protein
MVMVRHIKDWILKTFYRKELAIFYKLGVKDGKKMAMRKSDVSILYQGTNKDT